MGVRNIKFDLDPTVTRVALTAVLLFLQTLLGLYIAFMKSGEALLLEDIILMLAISGLAVVTLLQTFLKGETE